VVVPIPRPTFNPPFGVTARKEPVVEANLELPLVVEHPVQEVTVSEPMVAALAKRFVEEALVAKKFVVVAEVPVPFTKVKFWRVEEPVRRRLAKVLRAEKLLVSPRRVEEAAVMV